MKTSSSDESAIQGCESEKGTLNKCSENTSEFPVVMCSNAENIDQFKNDIFELYKKNGNSVNCRCDLISVFGKLNLNDRKVEHLLHVDYVSDKVRFKKEMQSQDSFSSDYLLDKNKFNSESVVNINHGGLGECAKVESKCSVTVHNDEISTCVDLVSMNTSTTSHTLFSRSAKSIDEDDLAASFSEIDLGEKASHDVFSSDVSCGDLNSDKPTSGNLSDSEISKTPSKCKNDQTPETENNLHSKHEIYGPLGTTDSEVVENSLLNNFHADKESSLKVNYSHFKKLSDEDQLSDEYLTERGAKKSPKDQRDAKKLSRNMKVPKEECSRYLKHMSGGSVISVYTSKLLNETTNFGNLISVDFSTDQSCHFKEVSLQTPPPPPLYYDQNEICPVRQGVQNCHSDDAYSFAAACSDKNLSSGILPLSVPYSDSNSFNHQDISISDSLLDMCDSSPASEISNCNGQNSRSTSPESGYGSSPRFSCFSDDGTDLYKYKDDQSTSNPSVYYDSMCSLSSYIESVQSNNLLDNSDVPLITDNYSSEVHHTEEDKQKINVIRQELEKCEEYVKLNNAVMGSGHAILPVCYDHINSQNAKQCFTYDASASYIEGAVTRDVIQQQGPVTRDVIQQQGPVTRDVIQQQGPVSTDVIQQQGPVTTDVIQQQGPVTTDVIQKQGPVTIDVIQQQSPSTCANIPFQEVSSVVSSPQVIVIYVPYAAKSVEKGQKHLKPILPKLEGQPAHSQSAKNRLLSTLDGAKIECNKYKIYKKLNNDDKNVIYIEDNETRQTNLHIAVIKHDLELAYCILEIHRQYKKSMSAVNSRDIYKKTALQYAMSNVMTLFVEYLREFGAK